MGPQPQRECVLVFVCLHMDFGVVSLLGLWMKVVQRTTSPPDSIAQTPQLPAKKVNK